MHECFLGLREQDRLCLLNSYVGSLNPKNLNDSDLKWLGGLVKPFYGEYWLNLGRSAQTKLLAVFGRAGLQILDGLVRKIYSEESGGLAKYPKISQRVQFWSNYLGSIRRFRLIISESDFGRYKDSLRGVELSVYSVDKNAPMVLILDLGACVVAQFLDGGCEEIRLWSAGNKAVDLLFSSVFGSPDSIRRLGFEDYSDHAYCWQSYTERLLYNRNVMVDPDMRSFHGLRPRDGRMEKGRLAQPEFSKLMERHGKIESWLRGFWARERRINGGELSRDDTLCKSFEMSFGVSPRDDFARIKPGPLKSRDLFDFLSKMPSWWFCIIGSRFKVLRLGVVEIESINWESDFSLRSVVAVSGFKRFVFVASLFDSIVIEVESMYWPLIKAIESKSG